MPTYHEKMFRQKPYTQCFECIQGNRIKCKKCMASLVSNIIRERQNSNQLVSTRSQEKNTLKATQSSAAFKRSASKEQFQVRTGYGMWMDRVYVRRTRERDPMHATVDNWPHKKVTNRRKMIKLESPRFQTWSGRLLARFSKSEQMCKSLQKGLSMRW